MTGEEIGRSTPAEINARIEGFARRQRDNRLFTAAMVSLPVINYSMRGPKHALTLERFLPQDFSMEAPGESDIDEFKKLREESENKRKEVNHG